MRNRLGVLLALTVILSFGGMTLAKTPAAGKPQNTNATGTTGGSMTSHRAHRHRKHRHTRKHRKQVAAASRAGRQSGVRR
jgi:type IV secretory pathway TrbL component